MKQPIPVLWVILIAYFIAVMVFLFKYNLPHWCATPEVGSNHIVQPLCPKAKDLK